MQVHVPVSSCLCAHGRVAASSRHRDVTALCCHLQVSIISNQIITADACFGLDALTDEESGLHRALTGSLHAL